jgi:hypothetical protein
MSDSKEEKTEALKAIEEQRNSKVIVYFMGDRSPFLSRISTDAVRPLYEHLLSLEFEARKKVIDLFLYSRGGDLSVPWTIVPMIREFCDELNVLVPYKCHNAAALTALGADRISMGRKGELSPIDPPILKPVDGTGGLSSNRNAYMGDMNACISFLKTSAGLNDSLIEQIDPLALGKAQRISSQIPSLIRKLLAVRREKLESHEVNRIVEAFTDKMNPAEYTMGRKEAKELGLNVTFPKVELEEQIWQLYLKYEHFLRLAEPIVPEIEMEAVIDTKITENVPIAVIESAKKAHIFRTNISLRKTRHIPPSPEISVNLNLKLPPQENAEKLAKETRMLLDNLKKQAANNIRVLVQRELQRQSPVIDIETRIYGGRWIDESE